MGLSKPNMFLFSEKVKGPSSALFREAISLELLKTIDPAEEICNISRNGSFRSYISYRSYISSAFSIALSSAVEDKELE